MAGHQVDAKTDICVIEDGLVQEGKVNFCQLAESKFLMTSQRQGQRYLHKYLHGVEPQLFAFIRTTEIVG
jgi:hypothetical protein